MLNEDPKKIPSSGGVSGEATAVARPDGVGCRFEATTRPRA